MNTRPTPASRWLELRLASCARLLPAVFAFALATPCVRAGVVFTRNTVTAEPWTHYTATFTPTYSANYTLGINLTAAPAGGDNAILIDAVQVTEGATTVFADGFQAPALATNVGVSSNGGTSTIGNWVCSNYAGVLNGSPPNWGLAAQGLGSADGTSQYAYLQGVFGTLGKIKAANTLALVAGHTYTLSFYQASRRDFGGATTYAVTLDAPLPTQTLTILGGSGTVGGVAANVEYYNPATNNWQPSYLTGGHPWGTVAGTNSWINYKPGNGSDPGAGPTTNQTLWFLYRVRFNVPDDAINPKMTFSLKADNFAQVAINGVTTGGATRFINNGYINNVIDGQADQLNADGVFSQAVHTGENTITINVGDYGGLNGFNFRIDLSMQSSQSLDIVPVNVDSTAPVIAVPADITREATSAAGTVVNFTATATDNVDGPVPVVASPASGSTFPIATTIVGLAASDQAGNTAADSFKVTVQDTTAPALTVPASVTAEATGATGAVVSYPAAVASDAVGVTSVSYSQASGSVFALGTTPVSVTARDAANNASTGSFDVTVQDTIAPVITSMSANVVAEATSAGGATVTYPAATATDAVGVSSLSYSRASGTQFPLGTTAVDVTAKDAASNASSKTFSVTVQDTTAPTLTSVSADIVAEATSAAGAAVDYAAATAADAVGVTSLTYSQASGSVFPLGATAVVVTAKDAASNASTGSFSVTVQDTTAPAITSLPQDIVAEATGPAGATVTYAAAQASDAVGVTSLTYSQASGTTFPIGTTTVTVAAKDAAGNSSTRSFQVTVRDTTAPAIASVTPSTGTLWPPNHQMVAVSLNVAASDAVGYTLRVKSVTSSEPDNGLGDGDTANDIQFSGAAGNLVVNLRAERSGGGSGRTYTIVVEASDAAGNTSTKACTVSVAKSMGKK